MPDLSVVDDGFEYKDSTANWPGSWTARTGGGSGTANYNLELITGNYGSPADSVLRDYKMVLEFGPINLPQGTSLSTFNIRLFPTRIFNRCDLAIRGYANPKTKMSSTNKPSNVPLTPYERRVGIETYAGYTADAEWTPTSGSIVIGVVGAAQQIIDSAEWESGDSMTFVIDAVQTDSFGRMQISAQENPDVAGATAEYVTTVQIVITDVNGGNAIRAGDTGILITGSGFTGLVGVTLSKDGNSESVTIVSNSDTEIEFDYNGTLPVGTGYALTVQVDTLTESATVEIADQQDAGTPIYSDTAPCTLDGYEHKLDTDAWPGTWEDVSDNLAILVGKYDFPARHAKAVIKVGPINVDPNQPLETFFLNLSVSNCYKWVNMVIRAVADPDFADLGAGNLPTNATLTTASKGESNSTWVNAAATTTWVPASNPKAVDVKTVAQEVINHANWTSGDSIQFVLDFTDNLGGVQGRAALWATENLGQTDSSASYSAITGPNIQSVSNNDILELGELDVTILGSNLPGASNLVISKGAISEAQTIKTNTATAITFDVTTGAIVPDTGYTLAFDIGGSTYSTTVEFVTGGGVNTGEADTQADGIEYVDENDENNTWIEDTGGSPSASFVPTAIFIGTWGIPSYYHVSALKVGPIEALQGQEFTTADLYLAGQRCYKTAIVRIYGVMPPNGPDFGQSNLPSGMTKTTAFVDVDTSGWAGANPVSYWSPSEYVAADVSAICNEIAADYAWSSGSSMQFIIEISPLHFSGFLALSSDEDTVNRASYLDYVTSSAANVANVNGGAIIRNGETGIVAFGSSLTGTTSVTIVQGIHQQQQTITDNTASSVVFDFVRGPLGYGPAQMNLVVQGVDISFTVNLNPAIGRDYVVIGTPSAGDNSLCFEASPAFTSGDIIEFETTSANGFIALVDDAGVPCLDGGADLNTFTVASWNSQTGVWFDDQVVTFNALDYFTRNLVNTKYFHYQTFTNDGVTVTPVIDIEPPPDPPIDPPPPPTDDPVGETPAEERDAEIWTEEDDTGNAEVWT